MQEGYPVRVDRSVFVPMDDGVRVALTLYLPDAPGDGPFPAVVESLPYRKDDDCTGRDWSTYAALAADGIAGARVDIRGTGASGGVIEDEYVAREQSDNLEVLAWLADQDWCTGSLGMWGISWGGFSALQTAMLQPPQLRAIAPMHATHDRFACDVHYVGGSLHAQEQVDWPTSMVSCNALPPDPDIVGEAWMEEWLERLDRTPQWPFEWLRHQLRDDFWLHGSPCSDYASIRVPTLLVGGWLDGYVDGMLSLAEHLNCPTRLVVGPWGHHRPADGVPSPTLDHFRLLVRWFGHHLRGDDNGIMDELAPATLFVHDEPPQGTDRVEGRWRAEPAWPPLDLDRTVLELSDLDHGALTWSGPQWVGSHAPAWDRAGVHVGSSQPDDEASMLFEGLALDAPLEILGTPEVEVTVVSDRDVGMVAARLLAVPPDGAARLVTRGNRNLVFPVDLSLPVPVVAGEPRTVRFPLLACSARVPAGWHLRLALAGADFPVVWPPGERFALTIDPAGSRLILPVVPQRRHSAWVTIPESQAAPESPVVVVRSLASRTVEQVGGRILLRRTLGHLERQPTRSDLEYGSDQEWTVEVMDDDPATTRVSSTSRMTLERPGWSVAATGGLEMSAGPTSFEVTVTLQAHHQGEEVFARTWTESVPRRWA